MSTDNDLFGLSNTSALNEFDTFGDVAAEDDAVLDYFISTNAVQKITKNEAFLVLGRKGTGKTAIVRYLTERQNDTLSKALNLRGYPWNVHALRIDRGASDIEAYVSSWRYLISVQLAALALSHRKSSLSQETKPLKKFLHDNYGDSEPKLSDVLRPTKLTLSRFSLAPSIMGNSIGGIELDRKTSDHSLGLELNALSSAIMEAVFNLAREARIGPLSLHFDELDQGITRLDESREKMLIGLILAAREIKRESIKNNVIVNPVVYLRTDLWDELQFSDKNKISQTLTLNLGWNSDSLLELVETRLRAKLNPSAKWGDIVTPDLMRGSQPKWNHILTRTFLRPRDVIKFLNTSLSVAKSRKSDNIMIENKDIVGSREEYSLYLKSELDDEIRPHWSQWDEALQACSAISTITFERSDFNREYDGRKSKKNETSSAEALSLLYRFSVIGYERRSGYGGSSWAFQYTDPEAGWDSAATRFKVHPGLKEYAKLREARQ
jgi:hypothetical protein